MRQAIQTTMLGKRVRLNAYYPKRPNQEAEIVSVYLDADSNLAYDLLFSDGEILAKVYELAFAVIMTPTEA